MYMNELYMYVYIYICVEREMKQKECGEERMWKEKKTFNWNILSQKIILVCIKRDFEFIATIGSKPFHKKVPLYLEPNTHIKKRDKIKHIQ